MSFTWEEHRWWVVTYVHSLVASIGTMLYGLASDARSKWPFRVGWVIWSLLIGVLVVLKLRKRFSLV